MREQFEQILGLYNDIAKREEREDQLTDQELKRLDRDYDNAKRDAKWIRSNDSKTQEEIFIIQREKQSRMQRLKSDLAELDQEPAEPALEAGERLVIESDGSLSAGGASITRGELMTDGEWGIRYRLDPHSVRRSTRKRFLVEEAKRDLRPLLDVQISLDESASTKNGDYLRETYRRKLEGSGSIEAGLVAERMVKNFLKKISYDFEVDFDVVDADVFQDVNQKIDFIIRRKQRNRGVAVEESEAERIGIQFSTTADPELLAKKEAQIGKAKAQLWRAEVVEDIVLVSVPVRGTMALYDAWKKKEAAGGTDKVWATHIKEEIFRKVLGPHGGAPGILSPEEIDNEWSKISETLEVEQTAA